MIPTIRIGNDFTLTLAVKRRDGNNESLGDATNISVQFVLNGAKWVVVEPPQFSYSSNGIITAKIPAELQKYAGEYRAIVKYRKGDTRYLAENCHAFTLTECCEESTTDTSESIGVTLDVLFDADGKDGLDAYELAVKNGEYTGDYAGYQDWLSVKATKVYTDAAVAYIDEKTENTKEYIDQQVEATNDRIGGLFEYNIVCWGDSGLSLGATKWGNSGTATTCTQIMRNRLAEDGYVNKVINCGIPSENENNIPVRQGAIGMVNVSEVVVPASSKQSVVVGDIAAFRKVFHNTDGRELWLGTNNRYWSGTDMWNMIGNYDLLCPYDTMNPLVVNGEKYILDFTTSTGKIRRVENAKEPTTIKPGTRWYTHGSTFKTDVLIIKFGNNSGYVEKNEDGETDVPATIWHFMDVYERMAEAANTEKCIFITPNRGLSLPILEQLEAACAEKWGSRHFNFRKYCIDYGLEKAGLTPTSADIEAMESGLIPPSLFADGAHLNDYGHKLLGDRLFEICRDLGYLTKQGEEIAPSNAAKAVLPATVEAGEIVEPDKPVIETPDSGVIAKVVDNVRITLGVAYNDASLAIFSDGTIAGDLGEYSVKLMRHCKDCGGGKSRGGWRVPVYDSGRSNELVGDDSLASIPYIEVPFMGLRDDEGNNISNYFAFENGRAISPEYVLGRFSSFRLDSSFLRFRTSWNTIDDIYRDENSSVKYINHYGLGVFRGKRLVSNIARFGVSIRRDYNKGSDEEVFNYRYIVK